MATPHRIQADVLSSARARRGFTVVEVSIVSTILVVGVLGLVSAVVAGLRLVAVNREMALGHEAARGMVERMQDTPFADVFATYNDDPADDPGAAATANGPRFAVRGLNLQRGDNDGFAGEILFPTVPDGAGRPVLSEDRAEPRWGMPRDLNGDGAVTAGAMPGRYMILPVRVRVRWTGAGGNRAVDMDHVFIAH